MPTPTEARRRRDEIVHRAGRATTAADVFAQVSSALRALVPFDAAAWLATDPATGIPTSPVRIDDLDGVDRSMCANHWQHELLVDDVNLFRHLARREQPSGALRHTVADPRQSRRFRRFLRPLGFDDELRAVLRVGDGLWGTVTLWRRRGAPPFSRTETAVLADIAAPLGEALRRHARPGDVRPQGPGPGGPACSSSTATASSCRSTTRPGVG